jgi:hypothetical protein
MTRGWWQTAAAHGAAVVAVLGVVAWITPPPWPTDQSTVEMVGQGVIVPGCADLNCFRILVPAAVELFPGPSLPRWRTYAVLANAGAAVATGRLALALGLGPHVAILTIWLSALGAGSFSMINHPYNADPFVLMLAPITTWFLLAGRTAAGAAVAMVGVFAKEFAAAPLYISAAAAALRRDWPSVFKLALLAIGVTAVWLALQIGLMTAFDYSYNANPSSRPLEGGYLRVWLENVPPKNAAFALFGAFGALTLLLPVAWMRAPLALRHLAAGAIPALLAFMYVATPERALWNFYFLAIPLAAIVLAKAPAMLQWAFVAAFAIANLRIGAQMPQVPAARYALAVSVVIALIAGVRAWRTPTDTDPTVTTT